MSRTRNLRKQFAGKFAVVTGGTQGLGEAAARLFAARGAAGVLVCGRNKARGKAVAKELTKVGCEGVFVEAEQDPVKAPPLQYARIGHADLTRAFTAAGYRIVR